MKRFVSFAVVAAISFACGCIVARAFARRDTPAPEEKSAPQKRQSGKARGQSADRNAEVLRARIRELESALAAGEKTAPSGPAAEKTGPGPARGRDRGDWLERMKKENPANYHRVTNNIARHRMHRRDRTEDRLDALSSVDVSGWSEDARGVHEEYQELLVKSEELMDAASPSNPDAGERRAAFEEMRRTFGRLHELGEKERANLMVYTMKDFGFDDEDARVLTESVKAVYDVTSEFRGHGNRGSGRGGRR